MIRFYLSCLLFLISSGYAAAQSFTIDESFWQPNGMVQSILPDTANNIIYLGGDFNYMGPHQPYGLILDDSIPVPGTDIPDEAVNAAVPDGNGGWYIGGNFTHVGDSLRSRIAHIDSLGKVTDLLGKEGFDAQVLSLHLKDSILYAGGSFLGYGSTRKYGAVASVASAEVMDYPQPDGPIYCSAPDGNGGWYIGGIFSHVGDSARSGLAHINHLGKVSSWNPVMEYNSIVYSLAVSDTEVYAGGSFTSVSGIPRKNLAGIKRSDATLTPLSFNINSYVNAVALMGDTLIFGGDFQQVNGQPHAYLARAFLIDNSLASGPLVNGDVRAITIDESFIYIGGEFTTVDGQPRNHIVRFGRLNTDLTSWEPSVDNSVYCILPVDSTVYIGGYFDAVNSTPRENLASINANTGAVNSWTADCNSYVNSIAVADSTLIIGGDFFYAGNTFSPRLAQVSRTTGLALPWNTNPNNVIQTVSVQDGLVYIGGNFSEIGEYQRYRLAAINVNTNKITNWAPVANNNVNALTSSSTSLFAGGDFTNISGQGRNRLSSFNLSTGSLEPYNPSLNGSVRCLLHEDSILYIGGNFSTISGQTRNRLAAVNSSTYAVRSWNPNVNGAVYAMNIESDNLYFGGSFTSVSGTTRNKLASIHKLNATLSSWAPELVTTGGERINALAVANDKVYLGGTFQTISGVAATYLGAVDRVTGALIASFPNADQAVMTISGNSSGVYVGGTFLSAGGVTRNRLAALSYTTGQPTAWNPNVTNGNVAELFQNDTLIYIGGTFRNVGAQSRYHLAAISKETGLPTAWNPSADDGNSSSTDRVMALAQMGDTLFVGGQFTMMNGQPHQSLAAFRFSTGELLSWQPVFENYATVLDIARMGSRLYVSGLFDSIGGQPRSLLGSFDLPSGALNDWNPGANSTPHEIYASDSSIFVIGLFDAVNGQPKKGVVELDPITGEPSQFALQHPLRSLSGYVDQSSIYFYAFPQVAVQGISRVMEVNRITGDTTSSFPAPSPASGASIWSITKMNNKLFVGGDFSGLANGVNRNFVALNVCQTELNPVFEVVEQWGDYTWSQNGVTYDTSGLYSANLINAHGCDSVVFLDLTIFNQTGTDTQTACDSLTWIDGITYYESVDTVTYMVTNANGCDSLVTLHLTINQSSAGTDVQTACDSLTWIDGITYYASTDSPTWVLENATGCDSVVTLNLTIAPLAETELLNSFSLPSDADECVGGLAIEIGGNPDFEVNVDEDVSITSSGYSYIPDLCAGLHDLQIIGSCNDTLALQAVIPVDSNYIFNNPFIDSLAQDSLGVTLENCDIYYNSIDTAYIDSLWANGNTVHVIWNIVDANGSNLDTTSYELNNGEGVYWIQLNIFCTTKSLGDYFTVTQAIYFGDGFVTAAIAENDVPGLIIFPNPSSDNVTLRFNEPSAELIVRDINGKTILKQTVISNDTIDVSGFADGVYFFEVITEKGRSSQRVFRN